MIFRLFLKRFTDTWRNTNDVNHHHHHHYHHHHHHPHHHRRRRRRRISFVIPYM